MDSLTDYEKNLYNALSRIALNQKFEKDDEKTKNEFRSFFEQLFEKPFLLNLFNYDQIISLCVLLDTPTLLLKLKFNHDEKNDFQNFANSLKKSIQNHPQNTNFLISSSIVLQNNMLNFLFHHIDEHNFNNLQKQVYEIRQDLNKNNDSIKKISNEIISIKNDLQTDLNQKIDMLTKELNNAKSNVSNDINQIHKQIHIEFNDRINNFETELTNIKDKLERTIQIQDDIDKNVCKIHSHIETVNLDNLKENGIYFIKRNNRYSVSYSIF